MKPKTVMKELLKNRSDVDSWYWCKPTSGHVEELSTAQEWELMGAVDSLWGSDPAEIIGLFEMGNPFEGSD